MTRDQKLEAMARAYCRQHGLNPDEGVRWFKLRDGMKPGDENAFVVTDAGPIWRRHVSAIEPLLDAIEPKEMAAWSR